MSKDTSGKRIMKTMRSASLNIRKLRSINVAAKYPEERRRAERVLPPEAILPKYDIISFDVIDESQFIEPYVQTLLNIRYENSRIYLLISKERKNSTKPRLILKNILFRSSPFRIIIIFMELIKMAKRAKGIASSSVMCLKSGVMIDRSEEEYGNA
jgi:hypothetical protein